MSQLKTVKLYGALTKFSDERLNIVANDNRDLISMMNMWFPEFKRYMHENPNLIIVLSDKDKANPRAISADFPMAPYGDCEEIHVFPYQEGAGLEIAAAIGFSGFAASAAAFVINIAISMALSAIVAAISPKPSASADKVVEAAPSFLYNGPQNVSEQGYMAPLVYGTFMTGSVVVSAGIKTEQTGSINPTNSNAGSPPALPTQYTGLGKLGSLLASTTESLA